VLIDTMDEAGFVENGAVREGGSTHKVAARSAALFEQQGGTADEARDVRGRRLTRAAWPRREGTSVGKVEPAKIAMQPPPRQDVKKGNAAS
jgi:hypothetical protein